MMDWISEGSCRGAKNPNLWFPDYTDPDSLEQEAIAKRVCLSCPQLDVCREHGMENEPYGIWGGTDELERDYERINQGALPMLFWAERRGLTRAKGRALASAS